MADEKDSHTQELSRAIDAAFADYRPKEPAEEARLYKVFLDQAKNVVSYRIQRTNDNLARDIVHRAMMALPAFRGESKLSTWFYTIAQNEVNRTLREVVEDRETSVPIDANFVAGSRADASDPPALQEKAKRKHRASENAEPASLDVEKLGQELTWKQDAVVALTLAGYSLEKIAEETGEPVGTIRSRYRLAKKKMAHRTKKAKK